MKRSGLGVVANIRGWKVICGSKGIDILVETSLDGYYIFYDKKVEEIIIDSNASNIHIS